MAASRLFVFFRIHWLIWLFVVTALGQAQTPVITDVTPSSSSLATQTITVVVSDGNGAADLNIINILINDALDGRNGCYIAYQRLTPTTGSLFLVNDAGDAGSNLAYMPVPSTATVSNSQCTINGTGSAVSESGTTLTLALNVTFKTAFGGNRIAYVAARDRGALNSGWKARAAYAVPPGKSMDPVVVSMTPSRGSSNTGSYTFRFQDSSGAANLGVLNVLINDFLDGRISCYFAYSVPAQRLYLVEDLGDAGKLIGPGILGSAGKLGNSQCSVNLAMSSALVGGNTIDLTLNLTLTDGLSGDRIVYLAARSANELRNSGWQAKGTLGFSGTGLTTRLVSMSPTTATQGQNLNATVTAQGTTFVQGQVAASLGAGVTVSTVTVNSPTTLTLALSVATNADVGFRTLSVTQAGVQYQLPAAVNLTAGNGGVIPGLTSAVVTINGVADSRVPPTRPVNTTGVVTLDAPVPTSLTSGVEVKLTANTPSITVPASVIVQPGKQSATFSITIDPVSAPVRNAQIVASTSTNTRLSTLTLYATCPVCSAAVSSLACSITGSGTLSATASGSVNGPSGEVVNLGQFYQNSSPYLVMGWLHMRARYVDSLGKETFVPFPATSTSRNVGCGLWTLISQGDYCERSPGLPSSTQWNYSGSYGFVLPTNLPSGYTVEARFFANLGAMGYWLNGGDLYMESMSNWTSCTQ